MPYTKKYEIFAFLWHKEANGRPRRGCSANALSLWGISGHHHLVICTTIYGMLIDHGLLTIGGLPIVYGCRYFTGETVQFFH